VKDALRIPCNVDAFFHDLPMAAQERPAASADLDAASIHARRGSAR
jgi:hypothetical protein